MAISIVPISAGNTTRLINQRSGSTALNIGSSTTPVQAGDLVWVWGASKNATANTSASPLSIRVNSSLGASYDSLNDEMNTGSTNYPEVFPDTNRYTWAFYRFLTASDITNGNHTIYHHPPTTATNSRNQVNFIVVRGVDPARFDIAGATSAIHCVQASFTLDSTLDLDIDWDRYNSTDYDSIATDSSVYPGACAVLAFMTSDRGNRTNIQSITPSGTASAYNMNSVPAGKCEGGGHSTTVLFNTFANLTAATASTGGGMAGTYQIKNGQVANDLVQMDATYWILLPELSTGPDPVDETDTATVADAVQISVAPAKSETLSASDSKSTQASFVPSESISASDTFAVEPVFGLAISTSASDSVVLNVALSKEESASIGTDADATTADISADSATVEDNVVISSALVKADAIGVQDGIDTTLEIGKDPASTSTIQDGVALQTSLVVDVDSVSVSDEVDPDESSSATASSTASIADAVSLGVSLANDDSLSVTPEVVADKGAENPVEEAVGVTALVSLQVSFSTSDSVSVSEEVDETQGEFPATISTVADDVIITPSLVRVESTAASDIADLAFVLSPDEVQASDDADIDYGLSLVEPSGVTGEIDLIPGFAKEESSSVNDSVDVGPAYLISESSQATDSVKITPSLAGKDSPTIGDDVDLGLGYQSPAVVDDTVLVTPVIGVGETAVIDDTVIADTQGNYTKTPEDVATVSDKVGLSNSFVIPDGPTVGDEVSVEVGVPRLETSVVADDVDFDYPRLLDDSTVVIGDASQEIGFARLETSIFADDVDFDYPKLIGDSITVGDEVSIQIGFARLETSLVADDLSLGYPRLISDDTEVVGDVSISIGYALLEEINVVPTVDVDEEGVERLESSATVGDDVSIQIGFARLETSLVADDLELGYPRLIADDSIVTDSVSISAGYVLVEEIDVVPAVDIDEEGVVRPAVSIEADDNLALSITQESVDPAVIADDVDTNVTGGTTNYVENLSDALSFEDFIEGIPRLIPQDEVSVIPGVGTDIDMGPDDYWEIEDDAIIFVRTGGDESSTVDPTVTLGFEPGCAAVVQTIAVKDLAKASSSSGTVSDSVELDIDLDLDIFPEDEGNVADEVEASTSPQNFLAITIIGRGSVDGNAMTEVQALATLDIWNVALNALGISTLGTTEGDNPQQTLLNNTFPLFRKQFLSDHLWNGAKRTAELTSITVDSDNDAVKERWGYVYRLPSDCMRVWRLNGSENKPNHTGGNPAILTNRWEIEIVMVNGLHERALCTEESSAHIEYVFDVGNNIDLLGPLTQHAMGLSLAAFVATNFGKSASEIAQLDAQAKEAVTAAKGVDGQEGTPQMFGDTSLLRVRSLGN